MSLAEDVPLNSPQAQIVSWLNERYEDFLNDLIKLLGSGKGKLEVSLDGRTTLINARWCL
jgi:hypothetical protein